MGGVGGGDDNVRVALKLGASILMKTDVTDASMQTGFEECLVDIHAVN